MSRQVSKKITVVEQGQLPDAVKTLLERDKLFFVEHPSRISFTRAYHIDEALPHALPINGRTSVLVTRGARQFLVDGIATLLIVEKEDKHDEIWKRPRKRAEHTITDYAALPKKERVAGDSEAEDITARRAAEHARQQARREEKQARRATILAQKRGTNGYHPTEHQE